MTENGNHDDAPPPKAVPPEGVLASEELKKEAQVEQAKLDGTEHAAKAPPTTLPVDPNYVEPTTLAAFEKMLADIDKDWLDKGETNVARMKMHALIDFLLSRIKQLEAALLPFANSSMIMANGRMCLIADRRPDEPAGGTWYSNVQGIQLMPNEGLYFSACDALGRQKVHDHIVATFEKIQKANADQRGKDAHVEEGGVVH